jgi:oxalate decarboxylase/phosphoglucose isomerase-like protein (cupin superfamily)
MQCGQRIFTAEVGAMVVIPRGIVHAFHNQADTPTRFLNLFIPGGFDEFVAELNQLPPADAADESKRDVIRAKYGVRFIRPGSA